MKAGEIIVLSIVAGDIALSIYTVLVRRIIDTKLIAGVYLTGEIPVGIAFIRFGGNPALD